MALPPPRARNHRRLVVVAIASGAVAVLVLVVVIAATFIRGDRPEEDVADELLTALFTGDGPAAYALTTPDYRAVVFQREVDALADALTALAPVLPVDILGSERTIPEPDPPESLVGYQLDSRVGTIEGVVTLRELGDGWFVQAVSHRFPDAASGDVAEVQELLRGLNEQVGSRLECTVEPTVESC